MTSTISTRQYLNASMALKTPVQAATIANITLSGEQNIDGVAVKAIGVLGYPDRVLVKNQTNAVDNGIWDVSTAAWTRAIDANGNNDLVTGTGVMISQGTQALQVYSVSSTNPILIGTTAIAWTPNNSTQITSSTDSKNLILNGAMRFDQNKEGGIYTSTNAEIYSLDQMRYAGAEMVGDTGVYTIQQSASTAPGFEKSLRVTVTTQQAVLMHNSNFHLEIPIEGINLAPLRYGTALAKTTTLSFWVYVTAPGVYPVAYMNGVNTVSYVTTFTVNTANIWEYKTVTIPGATIGSWPVTAATFGLKVIFSWGVGPDYSTTNTGVWQNGAYWNTPAANQLITQSVGNIVDVTGIQLEVGSVATGFDYLDPSIELLKLQRYYFKTYDPGTPVGTHTTVGCLQYLGYAPGINVGGLQFDYPIPFEASPPTLTFYNPADGSNTWRNISVNANSGVPAQFNPGAKGVFILNPQVVGDTLYSIYGIHFVANLRLGGS